VLAMAEDPDPEMRTVYDRTIVASWTDNRAFTRGGLCKKVRIHSGSFFQRCISLTGS
jgi:hypothetical protein